MSLESFLKDRILSRILFEWNLLTQTQKFLWDLINITREKEKIYSLPLGLGLDLWEIYSDFFTMTHIV